MNTQTPKEWLDRIMAETAVAIIQNELILLSAEDQQLEACQKVRLAQKRAVQAAHVYALEYTMNADSLREAIRAAVL